MLLLLDPLSSRSVLLKRDKKENPFLSLSQPQLWSVEILCILTYNAGRPCSIPCKQDAWSLGCVQGYMQGQGYRQGCMWGFLVSRMPGHGGACKGQGYRQGCMWGFDDPCIYFCMHTLHESLHAPIHDPTSGPHVHTLDEVMHCDALCRQQFFLHVALHVG